MKKIIFAILMLTVDCSSAKESEEYPWFFELRNVHYGHHDLIQSAVDSWKIGIAVPIGHNCRVRIHITDRMCSSALQFTKKIKYFCPIIKNAGAFSPDFSDLQNVSGDIFVFNGYNDIIIDRVIKHEFGHALGFSHSNSESDIMYLEGAKRLNPSEIELSITNSVYNQQSGLAGAVASGRMMWTLKELDFCYAGSGF